MRRLRYFLLSPSAPQRVARKTTEALAVAAAAGVVALIGSGAPSHWFAAGLVAAAHVGGVA